MLTGGFREHLRPLAKPTEWPIGQRANSRENKGRISLFPFSSTLAYARLSGPWAVRIQTRPEYPKHRLNLS